MCSCHIIAASVKATSYFPDDSPMEGGPVDMHGTRLFSIQDFLNNKAIAVSCAVDVALLKNGTLKYGTQARSPELDAHYGRAIPLALVDDGGHFAGLGLTAIDICSDDEEDSEAPWLNSTITINIMVPNQ